MKKESELRGLAILDKNDNSLNYYVDEMIIRRKELKVVALSLKKTEKSKVGLLLFKKIKKITGSEIVIQSVNDVVRSAQLPSVEKDFKENKSIIGFDVFTYKKEVVGVVKDTIINETNGKLVAFCMSGGVFDDLVEGYSIIPLIYTIYRIDFENENIIIEKGIDKPALLQLGGLKNLLGISKEK
ncbi:MAG: PRC-barrel domain-containing protein [Alkaliphilus sp.]